MGHSVNYIEVAKAANMIYPFNVYIGNKEFCCKQQDILDAIGNNEEEIEETLPEQPNKIKRKRKLINDKKTQKEAEGINIVCINNSNKCMCSFI